MHIRRDFAPTGQRSGFPLLLLSLPLIALAGCAPAQRMPDPVNWPRELDGRSLWTTPHAYIYAAHGASAGEMDRLAARVQREYSAELGQPTPPVLIIVRDAGEPYPGNDVRTLLRGTVRLALQRDVGLSSEGQTSEAPERPMSEKIDEAVLGLWSAAAATGTTLEVLAGTIPLTCDEHALRKICQSSDGPSNQMGGALVLPTRACLRTNVRRMMQGALELYGIGPVAQVMFAPIMAMAETKAVDRLDRLRDAALFNHWLFKHADLPIERKQEIAAAKLESWGEGAEAAAASIVGLAR